MKSFLKSLDISSFSKQAITKAVLKAAINKPLTTFPIAIGILGLLAGFLLKFGVSIFFLIGILGITLGFGSFIINYFFRNHVIENQYLRKLKNTQERMEKEILINLKEDLEKYSSAVSDKHFAEQGAIQFDKVKQEINAFNTLLGKKLNPDELAHKRYIGTAEQVRLFILNNLKTVASLLKSIQSIDLNYVNNRLDSLNKLTSLDEPDKAELNTLNERKKLADESIDEINTLLTENEKAITELSKMMTAVSKIDTDTKNIDSNILFDGIDRLTKLAHKYSKK